MRSVRMQPLPRTSRTIGEFDKVTLAAGTVFNRGPGMCRKSIETEGITGRFNYNTRPAVEAGAAKKDKIEIRQVVTNVRYVTAPRTRPATGAPTRKLSRADINAFERSDFRWIYRHGYRPRRCRSDVPLGRSLAAEFASRRPSSCIATGRLTARKVPPPRDGQQINRCSSPTRRP